MLSRYTFLLLAAGVLYPLAAHSIVIRDDWTEAESRAFARSYPTTCWVKGGGSGVLIAPQWILTAGHVAQGQQAFGGSIEIGGRTYEIAQAFTHPQWKPYGPKDIGLMRLKSPVQGIKPSPLATGEVTPGTKVAIVGGGIFGTGLKPPGPVGPDTIPMLHAGMNVTEKSPQADLIRIVLTKPGEALPMEAIAAPGDSGGPMFVQQGKEWRVVGVGQSGEDLNNDNVMADYGDSSNYTRVQPYLDWIRQTMMSPPKGGLLAKAWPDTAPKEIVDYFKAYNAGEAAYRAYYESHNGNEKVPVDRRVSDYQGFFRSTGNLQPSMVLNRPGEVQVLARSSKGKRYIFMFDLADGKLRRMGFRALE